MDEWKTIRVGDEPAQGLGEGGARESGSVRGLEQPRRRLKPGTGPSAEARRRRNPSRGRRGARGNERPGGRGQRSVFSTKVHRCCESRARDQGRGMETWASGKRSESAMSRPKDWARGARGRAGRCEALRSTLAGDSQGLCEGPRRGGGETATDWAERPMSHTPGARGQWPGAKARFSTKHNRFCESGARDKGRAMETMDSWKRSASAKSRPMDWAKGARGRAGRCDALKRRGGG